MILPLNGYDGAAALSGGVGVRGERLAVVDDGSASPGVVAWDDATLESPRVARWIFDQVGNGIASGHDHFNELTSGSGATNSATTADATHQLFRALSAAASGGRAARVYNTANFGIQIQFGAASSSWTYECEFQIPTISDGTDTFVNHLGFLDTLTGASVDGLYLEIDSNADAQAQFITRANSAETKTDTGVTIVAGTWYRLRIVVTNNTTVSCYLATEGSALGAAVATHTTNIPTGSSRLVGFGANHRKTAGSGSRVINYTYQGAIHDRLAA